MEERILGELKLDHEVPVEFEARPRRFEGPGGSLVLGSPLPASPTARWILFLATFGFLAVLAYFLVTVNLSKPKDIAVPTPTPTATAVPIATPKEAISPGATPVRTPSANPEPTLFAAWPLRFWWVGLIGLVGLICFIVWLLNSRKNVPMRIQPGLGDLAKGSVDSGELSVRVSIGETRCLREEAPAEGGLLIADDLKAYAHFGCAFYRLEFSLTMLPDPQRSLDRGEMSLRLLPDNRNAKLPFFVRLHPEQEAVVEKRTVKESADGKATFKIPTIGEAEGGRKLETGSDFDAEKVTVTSWGAGEQSGGWRFNATATRSIRTSITGLTALVAIPSGQKAKGQFRAAAHLRSAWKRRIEPAPEAFIEYEFPPTVDVPPPSDAIPAYI